MASSIHLLSNSGRWGVSRVALLAACLASSLLLSAKAADPVEEKARAEFKRGSTAYDLGRFEEARQAYEAAYELKPLPGFLFNIGQCYRQLGNYERAVFFYKRYLNLTPSAKDAATVNKLIQDCEAKLAEQQKQKEEAAARQRQFDEEKARLALAAASRPAGSSSAPVREGNSLLGQWWFWTGIGAAALVVAAAGGTTAYVLTRPQPTPVTLGTIDAR